MGDMPAKTRKSFRSRNELLIGTDFGGDGSCLTDSGYPRVVRSWKRGTPLNEAVSVFEAQQTDIMASQYAYEDRGAAHEFQLRSITFYTSKYRYRALSAEALQGTSATDEPTPFVDVPIPDDAKLGTFGRSALITLRTDWAPPNAPSGTTFAAGAMLAVPMGDVVRSDLSQVVVLFEPTPARSLSSTTKTKDFIVLKVLEDVRTKLVFWKYENGRWTLQCACLPTARFAFLVRCSSLHRTSYVRRRL